VKVINNTGATITTLAISYTGETWRVGTANRSDRIDFQYSTDATSLSTGTWTDANSLDYANPGQATGSGSIQHSATISGSITGLSIASGATFWIRWTDFDASGSDDGMAIEDFSIAVPVVPTIATGTTGSITATGAIIPGKTASADGGGAITARGVVVGTSANPTTAGTKVVVMAARIKSVLRLEKFFREKTGLKVAVFHEELTLIERDRQAAADRAAADKRQEMHSRKKTDQVHRQRIY
jgi:hypothetical protein